MDVEAQRRRYKTKQKEIVSSFLIQNSDRYLSVDEVWAGLSSADACIGRTTVYRCLETMASDGLAWKAAAPSGEARYRIATGDSSGQLVCLDCGRALPLDCHMTSEFKEHVLEHHSFMIDPKRTVLYGLCEQCMEARQ